MFVSIARSVIVVLGVLVSGIALAAAGRTQGAFGVTPDGAASYTLPLWSPPGVAGVGARLALVYHSRAGNGVLGVGWNLAGTSAITRCPKTWAQDATAAPVTLTAADRFCLDGERLRLATGSTYGADGTTYRTELERFARITAKGSAGNGPAWFQVETKDGLIYEYGHTEDARIEAGGGAVATVATWALNQVRDRAGGATSGNAVHFTYTEDQTNGSYRLASVVYPYTAAGGEPFYQVDFLYENGTRPDVRTGYFAGYAWREAKRLERIEVRAFGGAVLRRYTIGWESAPTTGASRVASIEECAGTDCLPATTIDYQDGALGWQAAQGSVTVGAIADAQPLDTTGNGIDDLVYPDTATGHFMVLVDDGAGGYYDDFDTGVSSANHQTALPLDFNSDSRMDLLIRNGNNWRVLQSQGTAFTALDSIGPNGTALPATGAGGNAWVADYDGDGRPDLIYRSGNDLKGRLNDGAGRFGSETTLLAAGNMPGALADSAFDSAQGIYYSTTRVGDFNGDGRADLLARFSFRDEYFDFDAWFLLVSNSNENGPCLSVSWVSYAGGLTDPRLADVNGDGLTDVLMVDHGTTPAHWKIFLSKGDGSVASITTTLPIGAPGKARVADVDSDGRDDLIISTGGYYQYARSTGEDFAAPVSLGIADTTAVNHIRLTDLDHDGLPDWVYADAANGVQIRLHAGAGERADLATAFTDGFGIGYAPQYVSYYQGFTPGAQFPYSNWRGALQLVGTVTAATGSGTDYTQTFTYDGARLHLQGRGFMGFAHRQITDSRDATVRHQYYRQEFPYAGMTSKEEWRQAGGTPIQKAEVGSNDWGVLAFGASGEEAHFPYVARATTTWYEAGGPANGSLVTEQVTTTTLTAANFGTPNSVTVETWDKDAGSPWYGQKFTLASAHTQFINETGSGSWCIGRPGRSTTTSTLPDSSSATRTTALTIKDLDYARCRLGTTSLEPDSATLQVTTSYGYDACGNVSSESVTGRNPDGTAMAARTTARAFGSRCQLPETVTNPLGTTQYGYDYDLGVVQTVTDPNNLTLTADHDAFGRLERQDRPDGTDTLVTLSACSSADNYCGTGASDVRWQQLSQLRDTTDSVVRTERVAYDGFDRPRFTASQIVGGAFSTIQRTYDAFGRLDREDVPTTFGGAGYRDFAYDLLGRVLSEALYTAGGGLDRQTSTTYAGRRVSTTDALQHTTHRDLDVRGQLRRVVEPTPGGTTHYAYSPFGQLAATTDAASNTTTWTYNGLGYLLGMNHPDRGSWTYVPDSLGALRSQTNARGQTLTMTYDLLGRPLSRTEPEGTSTWVWGTQPLAHEIGQLKSLTGPDGYAESYAYDAAGRLAETTITADNTEYRITRDYNAAGLPDSLTYPESTGGSRLRIRFGYDHGLLAQVSDYANPTAYFWRLNTMDARGLALDETLGHAGTPISVISGYEPLTGLADSRTVQVGAASRQQLTFDWDLTGNLKQRRDVNQANLTEEFFYDALGRLDYSRRNGVQNLDLAYESDGSLAGRTEGGVSYQYVYGSSHPHAVETVLYNCSCSCLEDNYAYDANGNMTNRAGQSIAWTSADLPSQIGQGAYASAFSYTPARGRWKQVASYNGTTETTTYLGGLVEKVQRGAVTEYRHYIPAGAGSMAIHTRRSGASPASSTYYVTGDHLGSATTVMDEAGASLANLSFAALGSRRGAAWQDQPLSGEWTQITATTRRGFTGHEHLDNLSLIHMNGRVYDPKLGRFLSADPVWLGDPAAPQSLNPYSYVGNNPLSATDPSGLAPCMGNPGCDTVDEATMYVYGYVPDIVLVQIFIPEFGDVLGYWGDAPQMPSWHDLEAEAAEQESKPEIVVTATQTQSPQTQKKCVGSPFNNFFANNYGPASDIGSQYNVDPSLLLGLAAAESGYGTSSMATTQNNPFGATPGGFNTPGITYDSYASAWQNWGNQWGLRVNDVGGNIGRFINNLTLDNQGVVGGVDSRGPYNTQNAATGGNPAWAKLVRGAIAGVQRRLPVWLKSGC